MARKDRTRNRKTRDQRTARYIPQMGYYLVVTDIEATERCYFTGLHDSLPENIKKKLVIKVIETKTQNLIQKCLEMTAYEAQYRIPWIVFDRDQVPNFDQIIKEAEKMGINVGWSNPCFEIWMFAYFGNMPAIQESWTCCSRFGELYKAKTGQDYSKADENMYKRICEYALSEKLKWIYMGRHRTVEKANGKEQKPLICRNESLKSILYIRGCFLISKNYERFPFLSQARVTIFV